MTRTQMLLWSAASGLIVGLLFGVAALAVLALVAYVVPGVPERFVGRFRVPALVLLLAVVPLVGAVLGYLEGRAKLP